MKNILLVSAFILVGVLGITQAHAFIPPYPYVLSQPVDILPQGASTINVGSDIYYYAKGIFYQMNMLLQKYVAVPPPIGAVVATIPSGYQLMVIDGISYYEDHGIYYKRVLEGYRVIFPPV